MTRWLLQLLLLAAALLVLAFALAGSNRHVEWLEDVVRVSLVIVMGGLGGALSGTRRILGEPLLRGQLDRFQAAFRGQVLAGGTLGLVALLLFEVGSLPTFQAVRGFPDVVPVVIYVFLAGFSEPFVLGVVQGLAPGTRHHPDHTKATSQITPTGERSRGRPPATMIVVPLAAGFQPRTRPPAEHFARRYQRQRCRGHRRCRGV